MTLRRARVVGLLRGAVLRMRLGRTGYPALQAALLWLVLDLLGGSPAASVVSVVLFSAITVALKIPVGGGCGLLWWRRSLRMRWAG